uniref:Pentacotripeptide-repeat region of PRORP domain-containing protein n=1 Tax=Rhodosorus marinus TaxID=101924 RepID=A0A7S2Z955_9RHOD|mmetsp:Transcript_10747/g.44802  ORF Transcript_10747/g.44802 Transcript_10747/m.44802 type:complete len:913 (+) Transcript_10747:193-2931(+)
MRLTDTTLRRAWKIEGGLNGNGASEKLDVLYLAKSGRFDEAIEAFRSIFHVPETLPSIPLFEELVRALGAGGRLREAEDLCRSMAGFQIRPTLAVESCLLTAYVRADELMRAHKALRMSTSPGRVLNSAVQEFAERGERINLINLINLTNLQSLSSQSLPSLKETLRGDLFCAAVKSAFKSGDLNEAEKVLVAMIQSAPPEKRYLGRYGFTTMLSECRSRGDKEGALRVFNSMESHGIEPNAFSLSALIATFIEAKDFSGAIDIFEQVRRKGAMELDGYVYHTILEAYAQLRDVDMFHVTLEEMKERGFRETAVSVTAQVRCYSACGWDRLALRTFETASRRGLVDLPLYNQVINLYAKRGVVERVLVLMEEMRVRGLRPNHVTYNLLTFAHGRNDNVVEALLVVEEMSKVGLRPTIVTYTTLMSLYVKVGMPDEALKMFDLALSKGFKPDVEMARLVIRATARHGGLSSAIAAVRKTMDAGGNDKILLMLVQELARSGDVKGAFTVLLDVGKNSKGVDVTFCNKMISFARSIDDVQVAVDVMERLGVKANLESIVQLVGLAIRENMTEMEHKLLELVCEDGSGESQRALVALLPVYAKHRRSVFVVWLMEVLGKQMSLTAHKHASRRLAIDRDWRTLENLSVFFDGEGSEDVKAIYVSSLADVYSRTGNCQKALHHVSWLRTAGRRLLTGDVNTLMRCGAITPRKALAELKDHRKVPSVDTFVLMLQFPGARAEEMSELVRAEFPFQKQLFDEVVRSKSADPETLNKAVTRMEIRGEQPSLLALLELQSLAGTPHGFVTTLKRVCDAKHNVKLEVASGVILNACSRHGAVCLVGLLVDDVTPMNKAPCMDALQAIVDSLVRSGHQEIVLELVNTVSDFGKSNEEVANVASDLRSYYDTLAMPLVSSGEQQD